jgi:hypothetical protein
MKAAIWSTILVGLLASSAQAFDYVDGRGFRHWNHNADAKASTRKEVVQNLNKPKVEIVEDTVKFHAIDDASSEEK